MGHKARRVRPAWQQTFRVGEPVIDTDHPAWGIGTVIIVSGKLRGPQSQVVEFSGGRHRRYQSEFGKLQRQSQY